MEDDVLKGSLEKGLECPLFIELVTATCSELKELCSLQEAVSIPQGPSDQDAFQLEMRSFLQELHCPHESLRELDVLASYKKKLLLVDFLLSELLAARLIAMRSKVKGDVDEMEVDGATGAVHSVPANLEAILRAYDIPPPPPHITVKQLFDRIITKVNQNDNSRKHTLLQAIYSCYRLENFLEFNYLCS